MSIQLELSDTSNFTNRKRIKNKKELFSIEEVGREKDILTVLIKYDRSQIEAECKIQHEGELSYILDIFVRGELKRYELPEYRSEEQLIIEEVPETVTPEFRLKIVSKSADKQGKIIAATGGRIQLNSRNPGGDEEVAARGILNLTTVTDLQGRIWQVDWKGDGTFEVLIHKEYYDNFVSKPVFAAHILPELVRAIASGILLRFDDVSEIDEDSITGFWVEYIETELEIPLQRHPDYNEHPQDTEYKLDKIEEIVVAFTQQRWGEGTLLEEFLK